jgi:hypothetical protein
MKLPGWAKSCWWLVLVFACGAYVYRRHESILTGTPSNIDLFVVGLGAALLLAPLFAEMEFLGVKLKQQIEEAKKELTSQLSEIRTEVRNAVDVRNSFSPSFHFGSPPPDRKLPEREEEFREWMKTKSFSTSGRDGKAEPDSGMEPNEDSRVQFDIDAETRDVFAIRYNLEQEVRRISEDARLDLGRRVFSFGRAVSMLIASRIIPGQLERFPA